LDFLAWVLEAADYGPAAVLAAACDRAISDQKDSLKQAIYGKKSRGDYNS